MGVIRFQVHDISYDGVVATFRKLLGKSDFEGLRKRLDAARSDSNDGQVGRAVEGVEIVVLCDDRQVS
jgi:hypothetical protein